MLITYRAKRYIQTASVWHWISFIALLLVCYRYFNPKSSYEDAQKAAAAATPDDGIDWSRFAYCQYVTDVEYLCNSLMMFEQLKRLGSKADRLLLYPSEWNLYPEEETYVSKFLHEAQADYGAHIMPVRAQHFDDGEGTWAMSFTKLLAFKQTQYERVLSIDSDATILKVCSDASSYVAGIAAEHEQSRWTNYSSSLLLQSRLHTHTGSITPVFPRRSFSSSPPWMSSDVSSQQCSTGSPTSSTWTLSTNCMLETP